MGLRVESNGEIWHRLPGRDAYFSEGSLVFRYGENRSKKLLPCTRIEDDELCLGFLGNNNLHPERLSIKESDRKPIDVFNPELGNTDSLPFVGKSAVILTAEGCDKSLVAEFTKYFFKRERNRRDHLHVATVGDIKEAGWLPYYAPLQLLGYIPHARVVSFRSYLFEEDPTAEEIENLASAFTKVI